MLENTMEYYIKKSISLINERISSPYSSVLVDFLNKNKSKSRLIFIASGSSSNAIYCLKSFIRKKLNKTVDIIYPFSFIFDPLLDSNAAYIVISQSGNSVNTLNAMKMLEENNINYLFITDNEKYISSQKKQVQYLSLNHEEVPFVTLGFNMTLFLIIHGIISLNNEAFDQLYNLSFLMQESIKKAIEFHKATNFLSFSRIHICGLGPCEGVAKESALKFCETLQIAASAYETEEFMHGGFLELKPDHLILLIDSKFASNRNKNLYENLSSLTKNVYLINNPDIDDLLLPLAIIPFFQELVYLINVDNNNPIPLMQDKYISFEKKLKSKTIGYYEEEQL